MSAASQSTTIRFFGILKNWFSKPETSGNGTPTPELTDELAPASPPTPPEPIPPVRTNVPKRHDGENSNVIVLPLQTIIMSMSRELRAKVRSAVSEDLTVSVPIEKVLPQLGKGTVKIPYGDVRRALPHVFASGTEYDNLPVVLPLSEILPRINPSSLTRRPGQKQVEQPSNDIAGPFAPGGRGLTISTETPKPTPSTQFTRRVPPQTAPLAPFAPRTVTPTRPAAKTQRISFAPVSTPPPAHTAPIPVPESKPIAIRIAPPVAARPQTVAPESVTARPIEPVHSPAPALPSVPELTVGLSALAESWPETMRQEIVRLSLTGAQVALMSNLVEEGLKRGRVTFSWKTLRSWIRPAVPPVSSVHDEIELELPLKVLAPMFLSLRKAAGNTQHVATTVDESIPNLFFGFPQSEPAPLADVPEVSPIVAAPTIESEDSSANAFTFTPVAAPAPAAGPAVTPAAPASVPAFNPIAAPTHVPKAPDTNYYVWDDNADTAFVDETEFKRKPVPSPSTGTDFMVRYATPNEIVSRAAALDGVAGAIIALPDGLSVANKIPENLNGDTLAAFLPQLFSKMSQCTKELRMGELNNLNFTVGNIPWKIFRVNAVFFAAFGYVGQGLPTAQLAALAGELDRKNKR